MNKEDIIRMAQEVGIKGPLPARQGFRMSASPDRLRRFAALVAAAEREACAKIVEGYCGAWDDEGHALAAAIRARA